MKIKAIKVKTLLLGLSFLIVIIALIGYLVVRLEGGNPALKLDSEPLAIGESYQFSITASDIKSGLRKVWIGLLKDGKEFALLEKEYSDAGFLKKRKVLKESFDILIEPKKLGISDGQALLRIAVWDYSWRRWFRGNNVYLEKKVMVDTKPPVIEVLSRAHNLSQGGAGLVIYRVSEPCPLNGVYIGENFFPGQTGHFNEKNVYMSFIALSYRQGPGTRIYLQAKDWAGNSARKGFPHYFRKKKFRKDTINITDRFLNWKMAEFNVDGLKTSGNRPVDKFLTINRIFRKKSYEKIIAQIGQTDAVIRWQGAFIRLPGSARKAGFADRRVYKYKGRIIDRQTHQGIDLASLEQSPVPASNQARVAFAGEIGIYGQTILLDHGFGLFSMYAHLSQMDVQVGQIVKKGETIGRTGMTGLAGGDHLHFGLLVHHVFVNPIEWWDSSWITNNIVDKIMTVKSRLDER